MRFNGEVLKVEREEYDDTWINVTTSLNTSCISGRMTFRLRSHIGRHYQVGRKIAVDGVTLLPAKRRRNSKRKRK